MSRRAWLAAAASLALHALALACLPASPAPAHEVARHFAVQLVSLASGTAGGPTRGPARNGSPAEGAPRPTRRVAPVVAPAEREAGTRGRAPSPPAVASPGAPAAPAAVEAAPSVAGPGADAGDGGAGLASGPGGAGAGVDAGAGRAPAAPVAAPPDSTLDTSAVRARIHAQLERLAPRARAGRVVVRVSLLADGTVAGSELRQGSGDWKLDAMVLEAVRRAAPFPPLGRAVAVVVPVTFR